MNLGEQKEVFYARGIQFSVGKLRAGIHGVQKSSNPCFTPDIIFRKQFFKAEWFENIMLYVCIHNNVTIVYL